MGIHNRILVVRTDRIGDVVLATPLIRGLRQTFPKAFIAAMVRPYTRDVLITNTHLDEIIEDDYEGKDSGKRGFWRQVTKLRTYCFDTALLLLPTERAAWMLFFAGIKYRVTSGVRLYSVLSGMHSVSRHKYNPLRHEADYCLDLGRKIGVQTTDLSTEIFISDEERKKGRVILESSGVRPGDKVLGIHPGSGGSSPNWKVERYAELAETLADQPRLKIIITGNHRETSYWQDFEKVSSPILINLLGRLTLRDLISTIANYDCLFSPSTGPMHIAAALKVPTVSLFCPLPACSPTLWGPQGNKSEILLPTEGFCQQDCEINPKDCTLSAIHVKDARQAILDSLLIPSKN